jgi:hypothetical protein
MNRRPSAECLDRREQQLRAELAQSDHADCFAASGARRRRIHEELGHIARWREIAADEASRGLYLPLREPPAT